MTCPRSQPLTTKCAIMTFGEHQTRREMQIDASALCNDGMFWRRCCQVYDTPWLSQTENAKLYIWLHFWALCKETYIYRLRHKSGINHTCRLCLTAMLYPTSHPQLDGNLRQGLLENFVAYMLYRLEHPIILSTTLNQNSHLFLTAMSQHSTG